MATERHTIEQRSAASSSGPQAAQPRIPLTDRLPLAILAAGLTLGAASLLVYRSVGDEGGMLLLWFSALIALSIYFWSRSAAIPRIAVQDLVAPALLALALAPVYLVALYRWPVQVSSDEIAIMDTSRIYADGTAGADIFGPSIYLGRPTLLFVVWGNLGQLLGGIELSNMRFLHAAVGLLVVAASYALFRQLLPRRWAIFASALLGLSHSLFMISRLAMRENTAVLVEVVGLALLFWGLRHEHPFATFSGGVVAGLGWYVYQPGRVTFLLWLAFLVSLALFFRSDFPLPRLLRTGAIALAGFALMAGPNIIAEQQATREELGGDTGPTAQLLLFSDGRRLQRDWVFADSIADGVKTNIKWGLGTFNNEVVDHSWIYENHGHGFVDPLSGILLWIGVGVAAVALVRRRAGPGALLALVGFVILWLSFAFLVNKAPNYTRLLVTLPFVAYFVTVAVRAIAERVGRRYGFRHSVAAVALGAVALLAVWNLSIGWDFVQKGRQNGDDIGSTGRYITSVRDRPGQAFYMAASASVPYYKWGTDSAWRSRMQAFARPGQTVDILDPLLLSNFQGTPPFSIFTPAVVWSNAAPAFTARYPQVRVQNVVSDGSLVVLDVATAQ